MTTTPPSAAPAPSPDPRPLPDDHPVVDASNRRSTGHRALVLGGGRHSAHSPCASVLPIVIRREEVRPMNAVSTLGPPLQPTIARLR